MTINRRSFLGALVGLPVLGHIMQRAPLPSDVPTIVNNDMAVDWGWESSRVGHCVVEGNVMNTTGYTITYTNAGCHSWSYTL